jgi:ribosomal protein S16
VGSKNDPAFRIVLAEKQKAVKKEAVEILGHYNPVTKEFGLKDEERLKYWIGQNVEISPTVHNLFVGKGVLDKAKVQAWRPKPKKGQEPEATPAPKVEDAGAPQAGAEQKAAGPEEEPKEEKQEIEEKPAEKQEAAKEETEEKKKDQAPELEAESKESK